jgi:hypothetical protein
MLEIPSCEAAAQPIEKALSEGWTLDAERMPARSPIVCGTADKLLP